jgi:Tfp pilus assembly protein FimT
MTHHPRQRPGYTIFELMVVLCILVIAGSLAVPSYQGLLGSYRIRAAVDSVRTALALGRAKAIEQGRPYRFAVVLGKGNYRLAPDQSDYWGGGNAPSSDPAGHGWVQEEALPQGVAFGKDPAGTDTVLPAGKVGQGSWENVVVFQPDGTANADVEIAFQARGAQGMVVRLRALTGAVSAKPIGGN